MHGIDEGELEIGHSGYYASSLLYWRSPRNEIIRHAPFLRKQT
jgi:hypothetical protein